jgi:hypothetical protein
MEKKKKRERETSIKRMGVNEEGGREEESNSYWGVEEHQSLWVPASSFRVFFGLLFFGCCFSFFPLRTIPADQPLLFTSSNGKLLSAVLSPSPFQGLFVVIMAEELTINIKTLDSKTFSLKIPKKVRPFLPSPLFGNLLLLLLFC